MRRIFNVSYERHFAGWHPWNIAVVGKLSFVVLGFRRGPHCHWVEAVSGALNVSSMAP